MVVISPDTVVEDVCVSVPIEVEIDIDSNAVECASADDTDSALVDSVSDGCGDDVAEVVAVEDSPSVDGCVVDNVYDELAVASKPVETNDVEPVDDSLSTADV